MLLVDQLDLFEEHVEELESLVRLFIENEHCVLIASRAHPDRLPNLTDGLRVLLRGGKSDLRGRIRRHGKGFQRGCARIPWMEEWLLGTEPREDVPVEDLAERIEVLEAERSALFNQVRRLSDELATSRGSGNPRQERSLLTRRSDPTPCCRTWWRNRIASSRPNRSSACRGQEVARLQRECEQARIEARKVRETVSGLRGELTNALREREEALTRLAVLEAQLRVPAPTKPDRRRDTRRLARDSV